MKVRRNNVLICNESNSLLVLFFHHVSLFNKGPREAGWEFRAMDICGLRMREEAGGTRRSPGVKREGKAHRQGLRNIQ